MSDLDIVGRRSDQSLVNDPFPAPGATRMTEV